MPESRRRPGWMRVFKTKPFARFAEREGIGDDDLCAAVQRVEAGLIDADLGGGVLKQRIARQGQGKARGFRAIILFRRNEAAFFAHGFSKSERDNIRTDELRALRRPANLLLALDSVGLAAALHGGKIMEMTCNG